MISLQVNLGELQQLSEIVPTRYGRGASGQFHDSGGHKIGPYTRGALSPSDPSSLRSLRHGCWDDVGVGMSSGQRSRRLPDPVPRAQFMAVHCAD